MSKSLKIGNDGCFLLDGVPYGRRQVKTIWDDTNETLALQYEWDSGQYLLYPTVYSDLTDGDNGDTPFDTYDDLKTWAERYIYFGGAAASVIVNNEPNVTVINTEPIPVDVMNTPNVNVANTPAVTVSGVPTMEVTQHSGASLYTLVSAASTNAAAVKNSAGKLYGIIVLNAAAGNRSVKIYNKASAPGSGDTPVMTLSFPQSQPTQVYMFPMPITFSTGIAIATTLLPVQTDFNAVGANELFIELLYK